MIDRRKFLMGSSFILGNSLFSASTKKAKGFKRLVCMSTPFGMIPEAFFPNSTGPLTEMPKSLSSLEPFKGKMTIFSGLDHNFSGGHYPGQALFSGVLLNESKSRPDGCMTIDQKAAQHFGHLTRFPYLSIKLGDGLGGRDQSFWTKNGIEIPAYRSPETLFQDLFLKNNVQSKQAKMARLKSNTSILDFVTNDISQMAKTLNTKDKNKLNEFTSSIRQLEKKVDLKKHWLNQPKPSIDFQPPKAAKDFSTKSNTMMDLLGLAFQTDSTRIATIAVQGTKCNGGIEENYHATSHHGNEVEKKRLLQEFEEKQVSVLSHLVHKLNSTNDPVNGGTLLDHTIILFGSGMSNGSTHDNYNLPIFVLGGKLKHKGSLACKNTPLSNLYLSSLNYLGLEAQSFGRSTATFSPLQFS